MTAFFGQFTQIHKIYKNYIASMVLPMKKKFFFFKL